MEMWQKLHEIFENQSETAKHMLQQQWYSVGKDPADDIAAHIAKIKDLAHRLSSRRANNGQYDHDKNPHDVTSSVLTFPHRMGVNEY